MIFLLVTLLALAILGMGSLGIDWGYASLVKARLDTVAHSVVLVPTSDHQKPRDAEKHILKVLGLNASTNIARTFPDASHRQVEVSHVTELPLQAIFVNQFIHRHLFSQGALKEVGGMPNLQTMQKSSHTRQIKSVVSTELRPARQVGLKPSTNLSMAGAIPCVLMRAFWEELSAVRQVVGVMKASGEILVNDGKVGHIGQYLTYVGQEDNGPKPYDKATIEFNGYVPILQTIGEHHYVVGFGHVEITGKLPQIMITVQMSSQASHNATIHVTGDLSRLTEEELSQIFESNQTLPGVIRTPAFIS